MENPKKISCVDVWVTKYALSRGVFLLKGCERVTGASHDYVRKGLLFLRIGRDCYESKRDAELNAKEKARRKISSLELQIEDLRRRADSVVWTETP